VPSRPSLILVGHGSSTSQAAEQAVQEHALTLRQSQRFGKILTYFIQQGADLPELPKGEVFILPFFMSEGFFVRRKIPELFGLKNRERIEGGRHLILCDAIGVDPELADIITISVDEKVRELDKVSSQTSVLLVAHGSSKNGASREAALFQRDRIRAKKKFRDVDLALLEEPPSIIEILKKIESQKSQDVVIVGLFSANGPHAAEDVPETLVAYKQGGAGAKDLKTFYIGAVGVRGEIVRLIQNSISRRAAEIG